MRLPILRLRGFRADARGAATIEFAFIAPVLLLMYFGVVELSLALEANRKVTSTASTIGDLVAQTDEISPAEVDGILDAAAAIMSPLDASTMELRVTSIRKDLNGNVKVAWSRARHTTSYGCGAAIEAPDTVLDPGESVIYAEAAYDYDPPLGKLLTGVIRMQDSFYLRPRRSIEVEMDPPQC